MGKCVWERLKRVKWWQWLILLGIAAAIAVLLFYLGPILASVGITTSATSVAAFLASLGITLPAWVAAAIAGLGSTLGFTVLLAIQECARKR